MGKRTYHRSGGNCEPLIKHLELSTFHYFGILKDNQRDSKEKRYPLYPRSRFCTKNAKTRKNRRWEISAFQQPGIPRSRDIPCTLILRNVRKPERNRCWDTSTFHQPGVRRMKGLDSLTCEVSTHDILTFRQPGVQRMKGWDG
jgi:hypothetical protein